MCKYISLNNSAMNITLSWQHWVKKITPFCRYSVNQLNLKRIDITVEDHKCIVIELLLNGEGKGQNGTTHWMIVKYI